MSFRRYDQYDGLGLAELVRRGEVRPIELVEEAISRIERLNPVLNAIVHEQFDRARMTAKSSLPEGPFHGVPFLLKDLLAYEAGQPSTGSSQLLASWRAEADSEIVARYKRTGVILLGRTNTPEFGIYGTTEPVWRGPTHNPWDQTRTAGGSSGGSAAAVAAGLVPLAHGGDGGGSIRIPASHCGLVGLKPTRGRTPMGPTLGESWAGLVCQHVLTRSVRDSAAMLDATAGSDGGEPYQVVPPARPYVQEVGAAPGKLRIAFTGRALFADKTDPACIAALNDTVQLLVDLGHEVEEAHPPFDRDALVRAYLLIVAAAVAKDVAEAGEKAQKKPRSSDFELSTWILKLIADKTSASEYARGLDSMRLAARQMAGFFQRYDLLLTPTVAQPPPKLGSLDLTPVQEAAVKLIQIAPAAPLLARTLDEMSSTALATTPNTMLWNMTGQPAISLPLYWTSSGLPIGSQLVGRFGDEATLLRLAAQLEAARPWFSRRPS